TGFNSDQVEAKLFERKSSLIETQQGLAFLSAETGGIAILNSNDLNRGIKQILDDQQGYYLIGYRPDEATFATVAGKSKFHHLKLTIKRTGNYEVRTRNSFYGRSEEVRAEKLAPGKQLEEALTSPFSSSGIQLKLTSIFANSSTAGS